MRSVPVSRSGFFSRYPCLVLLPALIAGISLQRSLAGNCSISFWMTAMLCIGVPAFVLHRIRSTNSRMPRWRLYSVALSFVVCGGLLAALQDIRMKRSWYGHYVKSADAMVVTITGAPQQKEKTICLPVAIDRMHVAGRWLQTTGAVQLYVYRKEGMPVYRSGQKLLLPVQLEPIRNSGNPGGFDYAGYMARNGRYHQMFAAADILSPLKNALPQSNRTERVQQVLSESIRRNVSDSTTRSLIEATILNERAALDETLLKAYSVTGIVHIIAISGMHISLLAGFTLFLLRLLPLKRAKGLQYLLAALIVWAYIALTGFPPSAVRAGVMFSLMATGILLNREGNTINTWAATGLLMLCYNPYWLYDIGVQLSFLAVLSILLFYPAIRNWIVTGHKIGDWLWQAVAVSIAAQILVFPLVMYYFHQFPLLGLLASIPAALYSILLLYGAIGIFFLHLCGSSCIWLGDLLSRVSGLFHRFILFLAGYTPGYMQQLYLSGREYWLMMTGVVCTGIFFYRKKKGYLYAGMAATLLLVVSLIADDMIALRQERIVVYNTSRSSLADIFYGKKVQPVYAPAEMSSGKNAKYVLWPSRLMFRATETIPIARSSGMYEIAGARVLFWNRHARPEAGSSFPVDFLVVSDSCLFDPPRWREVFHPGTVIIDGSVSRKKAGRWKQELRRLGIKVHWVQEDGPWIYPATDKGSQ